MKELYFILHSIFDKPFYAEWSFWLMTLNILIMGYILLENIKLRKEAQRQNKLDKQPYLALTHTKSQHYVIFNKSSNMAFNIFVILKRQADYMILKEGLIIGTIPVNDQKEINPSDLTKIDKDGLLKKIKSAKILVEYLERKKEDYQCVVYEDVFGNKIFSVYYVGSDTLEYDKFFESSYFDEVKRISN
jgi:hypothetical protein